MIRFHLLRARESREHLERLRDLAKELLPQVTEMQADRLLAIIDEEVTRANLRWLRTATDDPEWPYGAAPCHPDEPGEDVRVIPPGEAPRTDLNLATL